MNGVNFSSAYCWKVVTPVGVIIFTIAAPSKTIQSIEMLFSAGISVLHSSKQFIRSDFDPGIKSPFFDIDGGQLPFSCEKIHRDPHLLSGKQYKVLKKADMTSSVL